MKKIPPVLQVIGISAVTSLLFSAASLFLYFRAVPQTQSRAPQAPASTLSKDPQFAKYETIINGFLNDVRKGELETAYNGTSPNFQKFTSQTDFKKLIDSWQTAKNMPTLPCSVTEYSDPFLSSITGLPDQYQIVQTKCETKEKNGILGFNVEFIEDQGKPKISYINVYKGPILHTKE